MSEERIEYALLNRVSTEAKDLKAANIPPDTIQRVWNRLIRTGLIARKAGTSTYTQTDAAWSRTGDGNDRLYELKGRLNLW